MLKTKRVNLLGEDPNTTEEQATTAPTVPADKETAPAPAETPTTATVETAPAPAASDSSPEESGTMGALPEKYLENGYFKGEGKVRYTDPDLLGPTAEELAKPLAANGLKPSVYNPILRDLKKVNRKTMPLEAKIGALAGAMVKAKLLEQRKRAPHLLVEVLEKNRAAVQNAAEPDAYSAAYQHLEAVGAYLGDFQ